MREDAQDLPRGKRVRIRPHVAAQPLEGEAVVLDLESNVYYGLNDVGARFWALLEGSSDVDGIVGCLAREYDVEEATLRSDLAVLLESLSRNRLIEVEE